MDGPVFRTEWQYYTNEGEVRPRLLSVAGEGLPQAVIQHLISTSRVPPLPSAVGANERARSILECLADKAPPPETMRLPTGTYSGVVRPIGLSSPPQGEPGLIGLDYEVEYPNGLRTGGKWITVHAEDVSETTRDLVRELDRAVNQHIQQWFYGQFGGGKVDPEKWRREKLGVFISYRDDAQKQADAVFEGLGEYENRTLFSPYQDKVNMQAGSWTDQLTRAIAACPVFIPILSPQYLSGPIARREFNQAFRETATKSSKRIVPVLMAGSLDDYTEHWLGDYQITDGREGIKAELINEIARLSLGLSRKHNPYS